MSPSKNIDTELRLNENDLSESLLTIEDVAVQLKLSAEEVTGLITSGLIFPENFSDLFFAFGVDTRIFTEIATQKIEVALKAGGKVISEDIENIIRFRPEGFGMYIRNKKIEEAGQAFSRALEKFNLTREEVAFISDSYSGLIYTNPEDYLANDCSGIYEKFRQLQTAHPGDWKNYLDLDEKMDWIKPNGQFIISKNGRLKKIVDYINYLKVTGPIEELNDFEEQFTLDGYPSLSILWPIPPEEELKSQLEKQYERIGVYSHKEIKSRIICINEEKTRDWCRYNWGTETDIHLGSTKVFVDREKTEIFTAFISDPILPWIESIQVKFPRLTFLTYYRSKNRNMWEIDKTIRKKGEVTFDTIACGELSEIAVDPAIKKIVLKYEQIIENILHFDNISNQL